MGEFFGRGRELAALREAAVASLRRGAPAVMVVGGDPGSGKTRTIHELLAGMDDCAQVTVACYEPERRLPFALGRTLSAAVSQPLPAASERLVDGESAGAAAPSGWERRYEAVRTAVSMAAPIVITVDDVQWCDEESVALLHYIVRAAVHDGSAVSLVLAGRPSPPLSSLTSTFDRLLGDQHVEVRLGPLEQGAATALVQSLRPTLDDEQARRVADSAGRSPFWCEILATALDDPQRIHDLVARRLRGRSPDAAAALATVLAVGRPVESSAVAEIVRWPETRAATAVEELVDAGLVTIDAGQVRTPHDLLRAELSVQVPTSPRVHAQIAKWLEDSAGDDVNHLLAAADHLRRAGVSPGRLLQRAFASPRRRLIGPEGLPALVAAVDDLAPEDPASVALNRDVAVLAADLGVHALAAQRWIRVAAQLPDDVERSRAWLAASEAAQHLEQREEARHYLDRARRAAPHDPILAIQLDAAEAHVLRWLENDATAAARVTDSALRRARALAHAGSDGRDASLSSAYIKALEMACIDAMQRDAAEELLRLAEELDDVAAGVDLRASVQARLRGGSALMLVGRLSAAADVLAGAWSDARRAFLSDLVLDVGSWLAWTLHLLGRLVEAEQVASECTDMAARTGADTRPAIMVRQWRSIVGISRGEPQPAIEQLRSFAAIESDAHHRIWIRKCLATWLARLDGARAAEAVEAQLRAGAEDADVAGCARCRTEFLLGGAEALARIGLSEQAEQWLAREAAAPRSDLERWWAVRAAASLAVARGAGAADAVQHATGFAERLAMRLELVWALLDLADVLAPEDRDAAIAALRRAVEEAQRAGAVTEARLATRRLRDLGVHAWRAAGDDVEPFERLSPREREIATLVTQGASNLDIARTLYLSRKTIERHVSNIFAKLDVRNRAQLAARVSGRSPHDSTD